MNHPRLLQTIAVKIYNIKKILLKKKKNIKKITSTYTVNN